MDSPNATVNRVAKTQTHETQPTSISPVRNGTISARDLNSLMSDPAVRVIDISRPEQFNTEHIRPQHAGQVVQGWKFFDYQVDCSDGGSTKLVSDFRSYCEQLGLTGEEMLVFTEPDPQSGLGHSCRAEFIMKLCGYPHEKLGILSGGTAAWKRSGYEVTSSQDGQPSQASAQFARALELNECILAERNLVLNTVNWNSGHMTTALIDVRGEEEWTGHHSSPGNQDGSILPGRIPGAISINWDAFLVENPKDPVDSGGATILANAEQARAIIEPLGLHVDTPVILYCYKGARAALVHKVLTEVLGFENVRVYFEGWSGYARQPGMPVETSALLPSATRTYGNTKPVVMAQHIRASEVAYLSVSSLQSPGEPEKGYAGVDMAEINSIAEAHAWITKPLFRASESILYSPFYQWLASIESPGEFMPAAVNLWHHSATFPPVLAKRLANLTIADRHLFPAFGEHAFEESTHNQLLLDWMTAQRLISDPKEVISRIPTMETNNCVNIGHNLAADPAIARWIVTMNCGIERCSWHFFSVIAQRMRELNAGHEYFDVHVAADPYHSVLGLKYLEPQDPESPFGKQLLSDAFEGVSLWAAMVNSWIGVEFVPRFDLNGNIITSRDKTFPVSWKQNATSRSGH